MSTFNIKNALYEKQSLRTKVIIGLITVLSCILLLFVIYKVVIDFYIHGQLSPRYWSIFIRRTTWRFLFQGLYGTVRVALMAGAFAFMFGFTLMVGRISKYRIFNALCACGTEFFRSVPTLLFIYFFFLVVPLTGIHLSAFWKLALPVGLSACGVVSEVLRSGVNAVAKGQREASLSVGLTEGQTFRQIVLPQAIRYVIPSLIAELVIVLKDTTFAYIVSYADLMQNSQVLVSNYDALVQVYLVAAIIYILINFFLNKISVYISKRTGAKIEV